ncbi:hypothetical protein [Myroides profundi]|uniref:Uncharacterized protein n=1 Tax=Myroides profundi TaxID=480520 RepID=A0AAJ4W3X7_MYRPR|nr:hypothetical protein [Myroides profundi]AJH14682.1 hypothetical protein MPR_1500 [Myroides profundi]SEQ88268.1 hypothetical protein SAMN04488089_1076 [Myroides profundi]
MKYVSLIVLLFFVNFIATPTIAVLAGIELEIPSVTISEENKKPITNAEEEHKGHLWDLSASNHLNLVDVGEGLELNFSHLKLVYESQEFDILLPPPERLV